VPVREQNSFVIELSIFAESFIALLAEAQKFRLEAQYCLKHCVVLINLLAVPLSDVWRV
jgi:hypothetical protein